MTRLSRQRERGYILLTLMLFVVLLAIGSLAMIQNITFQMKRDREEELIHRGVQYSRAVRRYFKKFGHYPTRIEELENTNNLRFLRKRYKDPVTGKDFKPLHMTDVQVSFNPGAASMLPPGPDANISAQSPGAPGALNPNVSAPAGAGPNAIPGNQPAPDQANNPDQDQPPTAGVVNTAPSAGPDATQPSTRVSGNGPGTMPQTFGGGAIIGVASASKEKTIREFNKKNHYNQWQFIYDPSTDRGGLLMTPNQPPLQGAVPLNQQNGAPGTQSQQGFGQNQGFGNTQFGSGPGMNPAPQPSPNPQQPNQQ